MGTFDWIIGILLFVLCLGVLVTIHELGHFITAKLFKVYCIEFSIGFGPAIFSRKPKPGKETKFSIRALPLGGYVSMVGEDAREQLQIDLPQERTIEGIKKWKRAIVYVAGIAMNFILGFILILSSSCFPDIRPQYGFYSNGDKTPTTCGFVMNVEENSASYLSGISNGDLMILGYYETDTSEYLIVDDNVSIKQLNGEYLPYVLCVNPLYTTKNNPDFNKAITLYHRSENQVDYVVDDVKVGSFYTPDLSKDSHSASSGEFIPFSIKTITNDIENPFKLYNLVLEAESSGKDSYSYKNLGISFPLIKTNLTFKQVMKRTGQRYASANTAIIKALGELLIGKGWGNVGGPVAIAEQMTIVQHDYGFSMYLYYAGIISCNLALFNLIPFPGLDGWSLLVLGIEAITRKKVPQKVKSIVSAIGLAILFVFMIVIMVKDVIGLF